MFICHTPNELYKYGMSYQILVHDINVIYKQLETHPMNVRHPYNENVKKNLHHALIVLPYWPLKNDLFLKLQ